MASKPLCCVDFSALIRARLPELKRFSSQVSLQKGAAVYHVDEPADALFQIESGRAKVVRISAEGHEKIVGLYSSGDVFGELCVCEAARRRDEAVAIERLQLTVIHVAGLLQWIREQPEVGLQFVRLVCTRLSECQEQVATLSFDSAARRLAKELMKLGVAAQTRGDGPHMVNGLTHEDLANLIGSTREMVTALMNQFRERRLIEYDRRSIVVFPNQMVRYLEQTSF